MATGTPSNSSQCPSCVAAQAKKSSTVILLNFGSAVMGALYHLAAPQATGQPRIRPKPAWLALGWHSPLTPPAALLQRPAKRLPRAGTAVPLQRGIEDAGAFLRRLAQRHPLSHADEG